MKIEIVNYEPKYRDDIRKIVYYTGFGGESVEPFYDDLESFADMNSLYYTDCDDRHNYMALVDGETAGYLLGCPDTGAYIRRMQTEVGPLMIRKLLSGEYKVSPLVMKFTLKTIAAALRGEFASAPLDLYPAHLHIDFYEQYRRIGIGSKIMNVYFEYLRSLGISGVHLGTSSFHRSALPFYEKLGFQMHRKSRVTDHMYKKATQEDMYSITYVKKL
ncbi:MAG: GNAT family N-acetyltransferase [bacterium]